MSHGIIVILVLLCLTLYYLSTRRSESFTAIIPDLDKQQRFNSFSSLVNLLNPQIPLSKQSNSNVKEATQTVKLEGSTEGEYQQKGVTNAYQIPEDQSEYVKTAERVCESVKEMKIDSSICSNFDTPEFAENCGISFDLASKNHKSETQGVGGLYLPPFIREQQLQAAPIKTAPEYIYSPMFGSVAPGKFAPDKETCVRLAEEIKCADSHSFDSANCGQCFSSSEFHRFDETTPVSAPSLVLLSNAYSVRITLVSTAEPLTDNVKFVKIPKAEIDEKGAPLYKPVIMDLPNLKEGMDFMILAEIVTDTFANYKAVADPDAYTPSSRMGSTTSDTLFLAGFMTGQVAKGQFTIDLRWLLSDKSKVARSQGMVKVPRPNDTPVDCTAIRPTEGETRINLQFTMPFSFAAISSIASANCTTGPFFTKEASAKFFESDICYTKDGGDFSIECLIMLFTGIGGSSKGLGYPDKDHPERANRIKIDEKTGKKRTLVEINEFLTDMILKATSSDRTIPIEVRNDASLFMSGIAITNPCDTQKKDSGVVSDECIEYLYLASSTYSPLKVSDYGSETQNGQTVYCTKDGLLNPTTPKGLAAAKAVSGVNGVTNLYRTTHLRANSSDLPNVDRRADIQNCYGITVQHQLPEVFLVKPQNMSAANGYRQRQAAEVCQKLGTNYEVATADQLQLAKVSGAEWNECGWTTSSLSGIRPGAQCNSTGGVYCYGSKPSPDKLPSDITVAPFNQSRSLWSNPVTD